MSYYISAVERVWPSGC